LVSLNWYRNAHYHVQNAVKKYFHELIEKQLDCNISIPGEYQITYTYFYKNSSSDMTNVTPMCSKWINDALQALGVVINDNVQYLVKEVHLVAGVDKENPRCEIIIEKFINFKE
jgi:Holliday junction resolvase RusA-like endonuclease